MAVTTEQGLKLLIVQLTCLAIVWLLLPLRVTSRVLSKKRSSQPWSKMPWPEDATMFLGLLLYTLMAGFALNGIFDGGIGKHSSASIPLDQAYIAFRAWFVCELIYGPLSAIIRTSIALQLLRLLRGLPRSSRSITVQKWILYICMSIVYIYTVIYFFINLLQCSPPSYFWEQFRNFEMSGKCETPHLLPTAAIVHSTISAASDLTIAGLSAYMIAKNFMASPKNTVLQEKPRLGRIKKEISKIKRNRQKIVVIIFLSLGSTAGAVMLARINYITYLEIKPDFLYQTVHQADRSESDIGVWSIIEPCVGIVAGSLPYIRTLFLRSKSKENSRSVTLASSASFDTGVRVKEEYTVEFRSPTPGESPGTTTMCTSRWLD